MMSEPVGDRLSHITQELSRGLRIAVLVIAATILLLPLSFVRNLGVYRPLWPQLVAYAVLVAIVAVETVLVLRHQTWSRLRWFALAAAFAAALLSRAYLGPGSTVTSADWIFGALGWMGVILLLDRTLLYLIGFLALHEACTFAKVLITGPANADVLLNLTAGSLGTIGYPLASGIAALALRRVAVTVSLASRAAEQSRTADAAEAGVHERRRQRFADLHETATPLLQGLAERRLDPLDPEVQRACAVEAARMRRLFAETDMVPDPLLHELRQSADVATRRGVLVEFEPRGAWQPVPVTIRRALTDAVLPAVTAARSTARITVIGTPGLLSVSVLADCPDIDGGTRSAVPVRVTSITDNDETWVEAEWTTE